MRKLLIANRGEIAVRIARTCREMGIATVAVFSEPDADGVHVAACDEAIRIGGDTPATSYLRQDALLEAAERTGADAVHPGFGFLAENAEFAQAVMDAGLTWVGPDPDVIAAMGDKVEAKKRMADADVPLLPSATLGPDDDVAEAAEEIGYPVMVKAVAGGGGTGMRVVMDASELDDRVESAKREAGSAFGDDRVFLERYVEHSRHIEVQVVGDSHGNVVHLGERECSIQRRHQKVVEETPAPGLTAEQRETVWNAAVAAAEAMEYRNAGTVEFILDDDTGEFAFLEMNTRLQVEHPVTEEVTGVDLVRWQLLVADGEPLPLEQDEIVSDGHAIEVRLYAEDPSHEYLPATGTLTGFRPAAEPVLRWELGIGEGSVISPFYDPMLAKVIAYAPTRGEAASRLARGLERTVIQGVVTNRDLLVQILRHDDYLAGPVTTGFLADTWPEDADRQFPPADADAELAAVVTLVTEQLGHDGTMPDSVPTSFTNTSLGPMPVELVIGGAERTATLETAGRRTWKVDPGSGETAEVRALGDGVLEVDGRRITPIVHTDGPSVQVVLADANVTLLRQPRFPHVGTEAEPGAALSRMPGAVISVAVAEGDTVEPGDPLAVVEAMKMEHQIVADVAGTVAEVRVEAGTQVEADDILVQIDPTEDE